jgi:4-amino-4-deoxy-L-arabinose transferase-like glycosyltransferase
MLAAGTDVSVSDVLAAGEATFSKSGGERRGRLCYPLLAAAFILAILAVYYGFFLTTGTISHGDEYLTLDRSHSFVIRDDPWVVFSENQPTFKKPPLQYWVTAWLMERTSVLEVALRLPSYVIALLTLVAVGWLAALVLPSNPWVIPAAMLLMAGSKRFWGNALSALLDSGAVFFATLAVAATLAAQRSPRWWYVTALACGAGALQKAPIPLAFVALTVLGLVLMRGVRDGELRRVFANRHFYIALALAVLMTAFWPALQWLRFGAASFVEAYISQMAERFSPVGRAEGGDWSVFSLLMDGEVPLRLAGIAALYWLPFRLRRPELLALALPFTLYAAVITFATGFVSPRYSLFFLPAMMAALAALILTALPEWRGRLAAVAVICLVALGPLKTTAQLRLDENENAALLTVAEAVGRALKPEETLVCTGKTPAGRLNPGMLSYYASDGRPFFRIRSAEGLKEALVAGAIRPPLRGICTEDQLLLIGDLLTGVERVGESAGYRHWTADGWSAIP